MAITEISVAPGAVESAADPWGCGQTLEWPCPSPLRRGKLGGIAEIASSALLVDRRDGEES
jgi:hypothetical protein